MLRCEFHIPISPTPDYLRRIRYLAESIALYSGLAENDYRIIVTVGDAQQVDIDAICPWTRLYPIEWRWVSTADFDRWWYAATAYKRFCYSFQAPVVVMLDGDVLVTGDLSQAIAAAAGNNHLQAVPAYYSPFYLFPDYLAQASPVDWWQRICELAKVPVPPLTMEHPGWIWMREQQLPHVEHLQYSPPNPNAGVIIASAAVTQAIGENILADFDTVNSVFRTAVSGQIALTLAISRLGLEWKPLPLRYNFVNVPAIYNAFPEEARDIRVLHFLQATEVNRVADFQSEAHVEQLLTRTGLHPVNQSFVQRLREVRQQSARRGPL